MDLLTLAVVAAQALAPAAPAPEPPMSGPVVIERLASASRTRPDLPAGSLLPAPRDTAFEYSAAYYKRLDIHRYGSYALLPLFAFQLVAGNQLYSKSFEAPQWAKTGHRVAATGVAVLFTSNTITGVMNLYEGRKDPDGRGRKIFHASMMLLADAGFTATGILAERAERSQDNRDLHRAVAMTSMAVATVGYLSMLDIFRRD